VARWRSWPAATLAAIAFAFRTVGIALLVAWIIDAAAHRKIGPTLIRIAVSVALVSAWAGHIAWVESGPQYRAPAYAYQRADYAYINVSYARNLRYVDSLRPELGYVSTPGRVTRLLRNLVQLPRNIGEAVSTQDNLLQALRAAANDRLPWAIIPKWIDVLIFGPASLLVGVGAVLYLRGGQPFMVGYVALALLVIYSTPWPTQFNRYISPLAPFLALFLLTGAASARTLVGPHRWRRRIVTFTVPGFIAALLLTQLGTLAFVYLRAHTETIWKPSDDAPIQYRLFFHPDAATATDAALDWLDAHATDDRVVAATIPPYAYLRTGLTSVLPPLEADATRAQQLLDSVPVSFMIVDQGDFKRYTTGVIASFPDDWQRVYHHPIADQSDGDIAIYERVWRPDRGGTRVQ
jgi:hypothetical protein